MTPQRSDIRATAAFTLVELLTAVSIVALLMAIMVPSLKGARDQSRNVACLSNLRQMGVAANIYLEHNDSEYPVASWRDASQLPGQLILLNWDYKTTVDWSNGGATEIESGALWGGGVAEAVLQCPVFRGSSATVTEEAHTGYNYNTSYIGHGIDEAVPEPARDFMVTTPAWTALFGDGEWRSGANKFMRAPWPNPGDLGFFGRFAGTQGYRHRGMTNVAFCDGHAESWDERHAETLPAEQPNIAPSTGFLSPDNRLYDLQ